MKNTLSILLIFTITLGFLSCSGDDDTNNLNENAQKLIGTWGTFGGSEFYKKFTFRNDSKVEYYTYPSGEPVLEEVGDWSMDGNILTMVYPENVVLTFVQEVVFTNDNIVQFIEVSGSEYEAWEGTYYRAD